MKMLIKGKVWELPDVELNTWGSSNVRCGPLESKLKMDVPMNCCTKKLHRLLQKKFDNNKKIKMIILLGGNTRMEMALSGNIVSMELQENGDATYFIDVMGVPETYIPIDWNNVENEL